MVVEGLRSVYGDEIGQTVASKAAISQGRTRLGAEPLARLYAQQVQPIGPPGMSGVWYRGLRVMGLDGSTLEVADEAANAQHYGYSGSIARQFSLPAVALRGVGRVRHTCAGRRKDGTLPHLRARTGCTGA